MNGLPWDLDFRMAATGLDLAASYSPVDHRLTMTVTNSGTASVMPGLLSLSAQAGIPAVSGSVWIHGRSMHDDALVHAFGEEPPDDYSGGFYTTRADGGTTFRSHELIALALPARAMPALLVGSLRADRYFTGFEIDLDADEVNLLELRVVIDLERTAIEPGASLELPPLWIADGTSMLTLADAYAHGAAAEMGARVPLDVPTGWCSWYSAYGQVSEAIVQKNIEAAAAASLPIQVLQVDDGHQAATGDWLIPNERFPSGMPALATSIREAGYRPGLWLAPFLLHEDSAALRDNPGIVLRNHDGETQFVESWLGRCAILDCSKPAAEEWLSTIVSTVVATWGYTYLKLDALVYTAQSANLVAYEDPSFTAARNLRRGLEIIRDAAGPDTYLLGCTSPFAPAIGLVDGMRVGPDVKTTWDDDTLPSVRHAMHLALQRNFMHMHWWANDPDCLVVRDTGTELSPAEVRFLVSAVALSGGAVFLGDDIPSLSPARRQLSELLLPPTGVAAVPDDIEESAVPWSWRAELPGGRAIVGVLNWSDESDWIHVDEYLEPGELAFDVFSGQVLGKGDVLLEPHDAALWQVTAPGRGPRVVGDNASLTYARLYQRPVSGRIQVGNELDRPRTIAIEARMRTFEVVLSPGEKRWFD